MTILVVHLSDIHIQSASDPILSEAATIASCTYSSLADASHVFIAISGDIAFSGTQQQYSLAEEFLRKVYAEIQSECDCPISFIMSPGNHDCNFERDNAARRSVIKGLVDSEAPEVDSSVIKTCTVVQSDFFEFRDSLQPDPGDDSDSLWYTYSFDVDGCSVQFDCLNVSWVSGIRESQGDLYFPVQNYMKRQDDRPDIRLVVMHHPLNWYTQSVYRPFRMFVRDISTMIFTGHEHRGNYGVLDEAETSRSAFVEGGVLQQDGDISSSSFNVVVIDVDDGQFYCKQFQLDGGGFKEADAQSTGNLYNLPTSATREFELTDSFQDLLDDPGAFIKLPGRQSVSLSDTYVYPDLRVEGQGEDELRKTVSSKQLCAVSRLRHGVIVQGDEKSGCTSLLLRLYRQYHDQGLVPLLLAGKDLTRTTPAGVDAVIRRAIRSQYKGDSLADFEQSTASKKLILVDRLDDSPMKSGSARAKLLQELKKRTDNIVITVGELFEISELLNGESARELLDFEHYRLEPFNYSRRTELIERWYRLDQDDAVDEGTFIAKCEQAEQLMDSVMKKGVIPSFPLYLLTLLQSIEAGRSGDFQESALGYYYQYLLTEAFHKANVPPDRLTEVFDYVTQLAWEFHQRNSEVLSEFELRDFNARFSAMWHTVDFSERLALLERARVLRRVGDEFSFRYPYVYYLLKGRYLSQNLVDLDNRAYVAHCCEHLYVRDHENTILFLAHHTNDPFVLQTISNRVNSLFNRRNPVTFQGDTAGLEQLVTDAPRLRYSGESPSDHKKKRSSLRDRLERNDDGLASSEEASGQLSLPAELMVLFKTTEILGQVLKNQYSSITRPDKADLLEELFDAPLRALSHFYSIVEDNPEGLVNEIEAAIERHGSPEEVATRDRIARQVVAALILAATTVFLMKASTSAGSENLAEDVRAVVAKRSTFSYRLIELAIRLNSPQEIPRRLLESLQKKHKKDLIAERLIQILVINRLYMYKTTEADMQWLSEKLKLGIGVQHEIAYQRTKGRRLKH